MSKRFAQFLSRGGVLLMSLLIAACAPPGPEMSAPEAHAAADAGALTLVDIRTPQEWRQTGVPAGAYRVNMLQPAGNKGFVREILYLTGGDRSAPVGLICRTGNRSSQMQRVLSSEGFTTVYNVREGVAGSRAGPGWMRRGLPLAPCPTC